MSKEISKWKMKLKNNFNIFIIILFFTILAYGCANSANPELKAKSEKQDISQVSAIGTEIGSNPPDFTIVTTEGKAVRLSDFIKQQKPVIVYFMATWCPFCAEDYQELSKVYKGYEKNVSFLSISLDLSEGFNALMEYKKKYLELENTMFAPGTPEVLADYRVTKTTTKYAIDKNGRIIYAGFGVFNEQQWKTLLEELSK